MRIDCRQFHATICGDGILALARLERSGQRDGVALDEHTRRIGDVIRGSLHQRQRLAPDGLHLGVARGESQRISSYGVAVIGHSHLDRARFALAHLGRSRHAYGDARRRLVGHHEVVDIQMLFPVAALRLVESHTHAYPLLTLVGTQVIRARHPFACIGIAVKALGGEILSGAVGLDDQRTHTTLLRVGLLTIHEHRFLCRAQSYLS